MKIKLITKIGVLIGLVIGGFILFGHPTKLTAATVQTKPQPAKPPTTNYTYVARPGDNLTYMVRRSVQLYSGVKKVKLSPAAIIYCETNVTQKLGSQQVNVGQSVAVPFSILQSYIEKARHLTTTQQAAWQTYVTQVNFDLSGLNPVNLAIAQKAAQPHTSSASTTKNSTVKKSASDNKNTLNWYTWLVVITFAAAAGYSFVKLETPKRR